jgi:hypothetical protein
MKVDTFKTEFDDKQITNHMYARTSFEHAESIEEKCYQILRIDDMYLMLHMNERREICVRC